MKRTNYLLLSFVFSFFSLAQMFSQQPIVIEGTPQDSLVTFRLADLDVLYGLDGDTVKGHPYYSFLWIFGDGSFINGTRDSVVSHVYSVRENQLYHQGGPTGGANVSAYVIGNYSGGTRPPRSPIAPPGDPFRSPSTLERTFKLPALGTPDITPEPLDSSVIEGGDFLRLQFNTNVRPQDTMVSILSFRQPAKLPEQPIGGQLFLFYNSKIEVESKVKSTARSQFKNATPPPAPPSLTHGETTHRKSLIQFTGIQESGETSGGSFGDAGYRDVAVFRYDTLASDGQDERHLFLEMVNDSSMWELFKDGHEAKLRFLAVMTANENNPDILGTLPNLQIGDTTIQSILTSTVFDDNEFVPIGPNDPTPQIIGVSEVSSPVVSAHDPNALTLYACECPDTSQQKVIGVIDFSNDGNAPTTQLSVALKIPNQLNINSLENISMTPTPAFPVSPVIDFSDRTATWTWPALLQPAESAGMGHASTLGQITFALTLKEGEAPANLDPSDACITFDLNTPMCTLPTTADDIISTVDGTAAGDLLECQKCEAYTPEPSTPNTSGIDWWCALLWALGILLLILLVAIVRRVLV